MSFCEFCNIFKNIFFTKHLQASAFAMLHQHVNQSCTWRGESVLVLHFCKLHLITKLEYISRSLSIVLNVIKLYITVTLLTKFQKRKIHEEFLTKEHTLNPLMVITFIMQVSCFANGKNVNKTNESRKLVK